MPDHKIRCSDAVIHKPTGEKWLVAYADYETGELSWSGWPEGRARIEDCEIVRIATDEQHRKHVTEWLSKDGDNDHRQRAVSRLYGNTAGSGGHP